MTIYDKNYGYNQACNRCREPVTPQGCGCNSSLRIPKRNLEVPEYVCNFSYDKDACVATEKGVYISNFKRNGADPEMGALTAPPSWDGPFDGCELAKEVMKRELGEVAAGPQGPQGPKGDKGDTGGTGLKGATGETGEQGIQGPLGPEGPVGPEGAAGPEGSTGSQGANGARGETGPAGERGIEGPEGAEGAEGDLGATGETGSQGTRGPQGPAGVKGEPFNVDARGGSAGRANHDNEEPGFTYYDVETGLLYGLIGEGIWGPGVPFGKGPKGEAGSEGALGPEGPSGPRGEKGDAGSSGPRGGQGEVGNAGPIGDAGVAGPIGPQGLRGNSGPRGLAGDRGPDGTQGTTGPRGAEGRIGPVGSRGDIGPIGSQGAQGDRGPAGGPPGPRGQSFKGWFDEFVGKVLDNDDPIDELDVQAYFAGPEGPAGKDLTNDCDSPVAIQFTCPDANNNLVISFSDGDEKVMSAKPFKPTMQETLSATIDDNGEWVTTHANDSYVIWADKPPRSPVHTIDFLAGDINGDGHQVITYRVISAATGSCLGLGYWELILECDNCNCTVPTFKLHPNGSFTIDDGKGFTQIVYPKSPYPLEYCPPTCDDMCEPPPVDPPYCENAEVPILVPLWNSDGNNEGFLSYDGHLYYNLVDGSTTVPTQGTADDTYKGGFDFASALDFALEMKLKKLGLL